MFISVKLVLSFGQNVNAHSVLYGFVGQDVIVFSTYFAVKTECSNNNLYRATKYKKQSG